MNIYNLIRHRRAFGRDPAFSQIWIPAKSMPMTGNV
ncbi:hypothetical protein MNBD_GAMMA17-1451 [hydrothermal vent metagenome]|uniref:Uncharacterized protein n=1 Tax=hydrothermal vent metagenome TaxID=652676 RepID=A0A3B0ZS75_9ZZZZ